MLLVLAFVFFAGAIFYLAQSLTATAREREASLKRARAYTEPEGDVPAVRGFAVLKSRHSGRVASLAHRVDPRSTEERVGIALIGAGLARRISPTEFLALKVILGVVGVVVFGTIGAISGGGGRMLVYAAAAGTLGFFGPDLVVRSRTRSRRRDIARALPDALDLLAVSVEAGASFTSALAKLSEQMDGPLVEEFMLVLAELRVGESRANALRKMADRLEIPEVTTTVTSLIQSESLGSPLGHILKVQAAEARYRRQIAAEEEAAKAPVKMLIPTGLFIFPAMFIVIIGPAVINITQTL
jgi:tight adherence protein C